MGSRTDFEIHKTERGFIPFATTTWWTREDEIRSTGGIARALPFKTAKAAKEWLAEQFSVPLGAWRRRKAGVVVAAGPGDPLPKKAAATKVARVKRASASPAR